MIDILEQRTDVAVRAGPLKSSHLLARKLGETRKMIVGALSYLERCGVPTSPADIEHHNCLGFNYAWTIEGWPLIDQGRSISVATMGTVQISDGDALRHLAVAEVGAARLAHFQVRDDIAVGRLQPVLENCNPGDSEEIHAVFLGQGKYLPARVRAFLDFLVERVKFD